MMNFYVPTLGDKIYLEEPWTFTLHRERRNSTVFISIGESLYHSGQEPPEVTLPVGTELVIDRIYIRGKDRRFDSITFRVKKDGCKAEPKFERTRFWVKLKDANKIVCDLHPIVDTDARKRFHRFANLGE